MKKKQIYIVAIIMLLLVVSCSGGDSETGLSFWEWTDQSITELSIGDFLCIVIITGLLT